MRDRMTMLWQNQEGGATVKYAVMFALVTAACLLLLKALGVDFGQLLYTVQSHLPAGNGMVQPSP